MEKNSRSASRFNESTRFLFVYLGYFVFLIRLMDEAPLHRVKDVRVAQIDIEVE